MASIVSKSLGHIIRAQQTVLILLLFLLLMVLVRVVYVLPSSKKSPPAALKLEPTNEHLMVFLGLGGHTGEMIRILDHILLENIERRTYLVLSGDVSSLDRIQGMERGRRGQVRYLAVKRARNVGETLISSIFSTLHSMLLIVCQIASLHTFPAVLLLNGPGTCVPIAYTLFVCKCMGLCSTRVVYVESLARVSKLSMSGLLLRPIADRFLVQWPQLTEKYTGVEYGGILV